MQTTKLVLVILGSLVIVSCGGGGGSSGGGGSVSGTLDPNFGTGGKVTTNIGVTTVDAATAIAIQTGGKIVVAGTADNGSGLDFALARYNTEGSLDTSFGSGGIVITDVVSSNTDFATSVAIQTDGKVVVAGYSFNGTDNDFVLTRYSSLGVLDLTFGTSGIVMTDIGTGTDDMANAVAIKDGKIVVVGSSGNDFAIVRYNSNGSLDAIFDTDGKVITDVGGGVDVANSVAIQADGNIIVAGYSFNGVDNDFVLTRYTSAGVLDATFDAGGIVITDFGSASDDVVNSVAIQLDGQIVAAGSSANDFALARYTDTGALDPSFGSGGKVTTAIGSNADNAYSVAIQADGKIVAAGRTFGSDYRFALTRYNANGSLDTSFGAGGKVTTTAIGVGGSEEAHAVAIQSDGKIVAAGFAPVVGDDFALVRYLP